MVDLTGDGINDYDITNAGDSVTIGGVTFADAVTVGSGTGNYNTFLAISNNSGVESGFNSDDTPPIDGTNHDIDQAKTHTVKLSDLVIITVNGQQYYQFRVDLNEANSDPNAQISLDQFKLYSSTNGSIESTTTLFTQNLIYDMDATGNVSVLLSDAGSSGSGTDDYTVLVPVSEFAGLDPATTYVYLYVQMGAADGADWNAGATFEEWNLENGVTLTGVKFSDLDGDGIRDAGEPGVAGVTIFIDADHDGVLDAGERSTVTDANGNYTFYGVALGQTVWIDEVVPAGATQTTGDHEEIIIPTNVTPGSTLVVDPIGNHYLTPHVSITKDAAFDDSSDCADTVGELIDYTVTVTNDGELALSNVVVSDSFEGGSGVTITGPDSGDTNNNGVLDVGETWTYTYTHTVTQGDIDSNGGDNDGSLDNVATVNADSVNGSVSASDDASADVCQNPHVSLDKGASVDGDCADVVGELVNYNISVTNDGNVGLENVVVTDDFADSGSIEAVDINNDGFNDGDSDVDGLLDVGETWLYTAYHTVTQDDIDSGGNYDSDADTINDSLRNIATVTADALTTGDDATASDDATVDVCQNPSIALDKTASVDGDCADTVGELVNYSISVTNDGNVTLENVVVTDDFADSGSIEAVDINNDGFNDGDSDVDGLLDVGETWLYTAYHTVTQDDIDNNGNYDSDVDGTNDSLRNIATVTADAVTTGDDATASDDATVEVCQNPHLTLVKEASVDGDCADTVGELVNYTIDVTNDGNVSLENVVVTDDVADLGSIEAVDIDNDGFNDGDTDLDGVLDVGETWSYTAYHTVTQDDIDNGGNYDSDADTINDSLRNIATVTADAVTTGDDATASDDATVDVCQNPGVDLTKYVDVGFGFDDANTGPGPENVNVGGDVSFKITVENTGNVTLTDVDITDTYLSGGAPGTANLLVDDGVLTAYAIAHGASLTGDTDSDGDLDVGETWEIIYTEAFDPLSFQPGAHLNTADVTTDQGVSDEDSAYYFTLVDTGLCPRTPGFWQNPNNGAQFWDGVVGNEKHAGEAGFPDGELLYAVDSNNDGVINGSDQKGLLIGDYDKDGLTDADEDTLFVSFADAQSLINASNKQLNASTGDGRFMLGRDMVASWLNYLQGSGFGDASDPNSPHHYLDDSIDWMQIYSGTLSGGTTETFDKLKLSGGAIKTSTSIWKDVQSGFDHSASQMHFALDYYNNTGQTQVGGTHYANCADQHDLFAALSVFESAHPDLV